VDVVAARKRAINIVALAVCLVAGLTTAGLAFGASSNVIHGCVNKTTHLLRIAKKCRPDESPISWNQKGPQGQPGVGGLRSPRGAAGSAGPSGPAGAGRHPGHLLLDQSWTSIVAGKIAVIEVT